MKGKKKNTPRRTVQKKRSVPKLHQLPSHDFFPQHTRSVLHTGHAHHVLPHIPIAPRQHIHGKDPSTSSTAHFVVMLTVVTLVVLAAIFLILQRTTVPSDQLTPKNLAGD